MSMSKLATLTIGGIAVPFQLACDELSQSYSVVGAGPVRRLATTISGAGLLPPALAGLDWSAPVQLGCVASRAVSAAGTVALLPSARRTDAPVFALAQLAGGRMVPAPVAGIVGDQVALEAVPGALAYQVHYYPVLTVTSSGPRETWDVYQARAGWELTCEEQVPGALRPPALKIGGATVVPALCADGLSQRYEPVNGGRGVLRMANGDALQQVRWQRLRTTISGAGPLPAPLAGVDWAAPLSLACIAPRATHNGTAPTAARTDAPVLAVPQLGGVSIDQTHYYPLLTVICDGPRESWDARAARAGWDLMCEEV